MPKYFPFLLSPRPLSLILVSLIVGMPSHNQSGAATPTATSGYRTRPAVKRARNGSTGGGGSQEVRYFLFCAHLAPM